MLKVRLNLRTVVAIAICLAGNAMMFAQETGVVINGVKWATRNVDKPGAFAAKPEAPGMFYQWNGEIGWSNTDPLKDSNEGTSWLKNGVIGPSWKKEKDPSPPGWRIPTLDEIKTLLDTDKVSNEFMTENGVNGQKFTDKATGKSIFLPFVGYRSISDGELNRVGLTGWYWSGTPAGGQNLWYGYALFLSSEGSSSGSEHVGYAGNIRSVAE